MTLLQIALELGCRLDGGDPDAEVTGVSTLDAASETEISFLANAKYASKVANSRALAILAASGVGLNRPTLVSANPYHDFARALQLFHPASRREAGIHPTAIIAPSAQIGMNCSIGAFVVIGENVRLGESATLHPHAVIYDGCVVGDDFTAHSHVSVREGTRIGNRVTLQNGVVVGGDGFGFAKASDGTQLKIAQTGIVVIEDDVEVQTLASIDRATIGETRIRKGAKIDSLCQIGHGCDVGENAILCGQTGLAGSTVVESDVVMAGQTGSAGHLRIGKGAIIWAQSGIHGDVKAGSIVAGTPAYDSRDWLRTSGLLPKLSGVLRAIRALERRLAELESRPR